MVILVDVTDYMTEIVYSIKITRPNSLNEGSEFLHEMFSQLTVS